MTTSIKTNLSKIAIVSAAVLAMSQTVAADDAVLTDGQGMTLYTFDKDKKGESVCYDACAAKWPPYIASEGAEAKRGYKAIARNDGTMQWAYKGQPLYTWVGDTAQGDTTGDGVGGVWHVAKKKAGYTSSSYKKTNGGSY